VRRFRLLVVAIVISVAAVAAAADPSLPGPSPRGHADAATENARCVTCHSEIGREWKGSLHRVAYEDGSFTRALAHEDTAFCRKCHAPEADASKAAPPDLAAVGVGCITCHVPQGSSAKREVLASTAKETSSAKPAHPVTRSTAFTTSAACASCHDFDFPDGNARVRPEPMQLTVKEHEKLGPKNGGATCSSCHMPLVTEGSRSHRSHAFVASRSPEMLKRAARISVRRTDEAIEVVFGRGDIGHAFPTGDLFRRLVVHARIEGDPEKAQQVRYLTRHFAQRQQLPGVFVRVVARDDRPFADGENEHVAKLVLGERAKGRRIVWRVVYQRVQEVAPMNEDRAILDGEIEIASGVVE